MLNGTKKVCPNCKGKWIEGDKYCRYCGAPMDKPVFVPSSIQCIYGPRPIEREHHCTGCGHSWTTQLMIDREGFCPLCGKPAPVVHGEADKLRRRL